MIGSVMADTKLIIVLQDFRTGRSHLATVKQVIRETPELLNSFVWYESPLHYAVRENQTDVVRELLAAGVNPGYSNFTYSSWQSILPIAK